MAPLDLSRPVLALEAATACGSVALLLPRGESRSRVVRMGAGAADGLFPAMLSLLEESEISPRDLGAVVCGEGPGSFTSLRIAGALAKGVAHGVGLPLYAVPSLALAAAALSASIPPGAYVVHADALRGERYAQRVLLDETGQVHPASPVTRCTVDDLRASTDPLVAVGLAPEVLPSAWSGDPDAAAVLHMQGAWRDEPVALASWEPLYGRLAEAQVKWESEHGRALPGASA